MRKGKTVKKIISAATVLLMLFSCLAFTSCKDEQEQNQGDTSAVYEDPEEIVPDYLPENLNFGGEEVTFLVMGEGINTPDWKSRDIYQESESEDPIEDAVYRRNLYIESKYNVKIKAVYSDTPRNAVETSVKSNTDEYDVVMCPTGDTVSLAANLSLKDLNEVGYIDLTRE